MYFARHVESATDNVFLRLSRTASTPTPTMYLAPSSTPTISPSDSISFSDGDNNGTNIGTISSIVLSSTFLIGLFVLLSSRRCRQRNVPKPESDPGCYLESYISTTNSFASSNEKDENEPSLMSSEGNFDIENQHGTSGYDIDADESKWYLEKSHPSAKTRIIYDCDEDIVNVSSPIINRDFSDGETQHHALLSIDVPELDDTSGHDDNEPEIYAGAMILLLMAFEQCQQCRIQQEESERCMECLIPPDDNETTTLKNEHELSNLDQQPHEHVVVDLTESDDQGHAFDHDCYEFSSSVHYEGVFTRDLPHGLPRSDSDEDDNVDGNDDSNTTNIFDLLQQDVFDDLWNHIEECEDDPGDCKSSVCTVYIGPIDIDSGENVRDTNGLDRDDVGENDVSDPSNDCDDNHRPMEDSQHNVTNISDSLPHAHVHALPNPPVHPANDVVAVSHIRSGPIDIDSGQAVVVVIPVTTPRSSTNIIVTTTHGRPRRPTIQKRRPSVKASRDDYFRARHAIRTRRSSVKLLSSIVEEMTEMDDVISVSSSSSSMTVPGRHNLLVV